MPRMSRMAVVGKKAVYHVMSRTALDGYPFGDVEKDQMVKIIKQFSNLYFAEVLGYCIMGNHFHILVRMNPEHEYSDEQIKERFHMFYGKERWFEESQIPDLREKWSSISWYVKELKQTFSRYYNKLHGRRGTLWGERFKSVLVEKGESLVNCLTYIDLNPIRAGIVERPEDYRWSSFGYHSQQGNKDGFLSLDFGLKEFGVADPAERFRLYRRRVYESGGLERNDGKSKQIISSKLLEKEIENEFKVSRIKCFRSRTRYFTDSGIIGSKAYVMETYQEFKEMFDGKREKKPNPVTGIDGLYSIRRLT